MNFEYQLMRISNKIENIKVDLGKLIDESIELGYEDENLIQAKEIYIELETISESIDEMLGIK